MQTHPHRTAAPVTNQARRGQLCWGNRGGRSEGLHSAAPNYLQGKRESAAKSQEREGDRRKRQSAGRVFQASGLKDQGLNTQKKGGNLVQGNEPWTPEG